MMKHVTSEPNINITASESKILFNNIGRFVSEISFGTIRTKIDLSPLVSENNAFCNTTNILQSRLRIKLSDCNGNVTKPEDLLKTWDRTKDGVTLHWYIQKPWKGYVKKKLTKALLMEMKHTTD